MIGCAKGKLTFPAKNTINFRPHLAIMHSCKTNTYVTRGDCPSKFIKKVPRIDKLFHRQYS